MPYIAILIVSLIFAIVASILAFVFIVPEKKRGILNKFGKFLHDLLNFKFLILEKILKGLYIFSTTFIILLGFFMLFWIEQTSYGYYSATKIEWLGYNGLLVLLFGPILIRIIYEFAIMVILAVNNIISINNKLPDLTASNIQLNDKTDAKEQNNVHKERVIRYCSKCGNVLDENNKCTNCQTQFDF